METKEIINIEKHLGLVHACCQRFKNRGIEYDDIFQSGCLGLTKAAKNFDWGKKVKFSTYAVPVILGEIKCLFRENSSLKVSRKLKDLAMKIKYQRERFIDIYSREPTINEISSILSTTQEQIIEAMEICKIPIPLNTSENDENYIENDIPIPPEDEKIFLKLSISEVFSKFESKDKRLIYLRFFKGITQSKIARLLGMTQVQVSRKEKFILKKLREKLE